MRREAAIRETSALLLHVIRRHLEAEERFSWARAVEIALVQLSRPGRPAARLTPALRERLERQLSELARGLVDPTDPRQLEAFCRRAAEAAHAAVPKARHPGPRLKDVASDLKSLAKAAVYAEYGRAKDQDDLVRRAVTRALRERGRTRRHLARLALDESDPLRSLLELPDRGPVYLPPRDLRVHLAAGRTKEGKDSALPGLLRQAARFSERTLRPALGEELWGLCRPVGFADRRCTRVLVQVTSSALAHEVSMRKQELLMRLAHVPGFEGVRDVRFVVEERKAIPVVGEKARPAPAPVEEPRATAKDPLLRQQLERFLARGRGGDDD